MTYLVATPAAGWNAPSSRFVVDGRYAALGCAGAFARCAGTSAAACRRGVADRNGRHRGHQWRRGWPGFDRAQLLAWGPSRAAHDDAVDGRRSDVRGRLRRSPARRAGRGRHVAAWYRAERLQRRHTGLRSYATFRCCSRCGTTASRCQLREPRPDLGGLPLVAASRSRRSGSSAARDLAAHRDRGRVIRVARARLLGTALLSMARCCCSWPACCSSSSASSRSDRHGDRRPARR